MARPVDPMRRAIPFAEWPGLDRAAWEAAVAEGDIFDGQGPAAHWANRTKQTNIQNYGRWLGWLLWSGQLVTEAVPADRVTPEMVRAYYHHLSRLVAPVTVLSLLVGLKVTIAAMEPGRSWRWLQDLCNRAQRRAKPKTDKRSRIRPTGEIYVAALRELEELPSEDINLHQAVRYRDALILALLAARPLRVRNATSIELGRHLIRIDDRWLLTFPDEETKNRQPIEFFLPDDLCPWLEHYLAAVRPVFPGADQSNTLWLNQYGPVTSPRFIYIRLIKLTKRLFGTAINPHLLRDCAASSLALVSADMARAAAPLLGHRHFSTTERYYIQANELEASRRLNKIIAEITRTVEPTE